MARLGPQVGNEVACGVLAAKRAAPDNGPAPEARVDRGRTMTHGGRASARLSHARNRSGGGMASPFENAAKVPYWRKNICSTNKVSLHSLS